MKDKTTSKIEDHWFDCGSYKPHGEFISIGAGTLKSLQNCYVYCGMNVNKSTFIKMLDDYFSREKLYECYEIEKWCKLQYKWYDVIINGEKLPFMVNKCGDFVYRETKEPIYPRYNRSIYKKSNDKWYDLCLFKFAYKNDSGIVKIERKMLEILMESLPYTMEEIMKNCGI